MSRFARNRPRVGSVSEARSARYMTRFRCLGSACEDNCCSHSWDIGLDRGDYLTLKKSLADSSEGRERFAQACERARGRDDRKWQYAVLRRTAAGSCVFLGSQGLCTVQAEHGPDALPGVCTTYPRRAMAWGERVELTATLSCPETARLCLLAEDALELDVIDPEPLRMLLAEPLRLPSWAADPGATTFASVRAAFLGLFRRREHPLLTRFYHAAQLAQRLDLLRPALRGGGALADLTQTLAFGADAQAAAEADRARRVSSASGVLAFVAVQQLLVGLARQPGAGRLTDLVNRAYEPYLDRDESPPDGEPAYELRGEDLWAGYGARRAAWERRFASRIEQYFENYVLNFLLQVAYPNASTLLDYFLQLLARVAAIRFLLFTHPALEAGDGSLVDREALDAAAVDACYTFTRAVEHSPEIRDQVGLVLRTYGMGELEHVLEFAAL